MALIGTEADLKEIIAAARWYPADALSLRSDVRIAADAVFKRQYEDAPFSNLYLWRSRPRTPRLWRRCCLTVGRKSSPETG